MAKKINVHQAPSPGGEGEPEPAGRPRARPARREHHGVLQAVQRADSGLEAGIPVPVVISVYSDRSFTFIMKTPPATCC